MQISCTNITQSVTSLLCFKFVHCVQITMKFCAIHHMPKHHALLPKVCGDHKLTNEHEWSIARFSLRTPKKGQSNRKKGGSIMAVR